MALSKKELEEEIKAVETILKIHRDQVILNLKGEKVNSFVLELFQKELEKFK